MRNALAALLSGLLFAVAATAAELPRFDQTPPDRRVPGTRYVDEGGQVIYWPRAQPTSAEVYGNKLHQYPNYRRGYADKDYVTDGFDAARLGTLPPPGQHPRLYVTPDDFQRIRDHVAKGDAAPYYFRVFWAVFKQQTGVGDDGRIAPDKIADVTGTGYSMVNPFLRQIIYAQIMNDEALGQELARRLAAQAREDLKVIELYDQQPFRDNFWVVSDTRWLPDGHPMKGRGQWYWPMYPEAYDYAWRWLDDAGRAAVRQVLAAIIRDRFTHFMELPANHHLINHASMAMLFASYFLALEGEAGYDAKQYAVVREKFDEVLEYYISPSGVMYENVKGFLPWQIYLDMARREGGRPLRHPHLFAHMRQAIFTARNVQSTYASWTRPPVRVSPENNAFAKAFWDPRGDWRSRTWQVEGSGHALMFLAMMHYFYPARKDFDLVFKATCHTANLDFVLDQSLATWVRDLEFPALMLAFASDGILGDDGKPVDWNRTPVDFMPETTHADLERGLGQMRSSWDADALQLNVDCRSDFYTGGHETPDLGNFNFAAHGIYWAPYFGAYQPAVHRNVITVDGQNGSMPSVGGDFLSQEDTPVATTAVMEYSRGMQFNQQTRNELIRHPKLSLPFHQWMAGGYGWGRTRTWQAACAPSSRWFEEYQASVDFGHWDCQNTGGAFYERLLPEVAYAWRTLQLVKGAHPFLLILDDVRLDDQVHDFRFNLNLNPDLVLISQPMADEMILGRADMAKRHQGVGREWAWQIPQREPLLLVKVLHRDTAAEFPRPGYAMADNKAMVTIPARTVSPSFKTLIYPYRQGDPTPGISWSEDRTRLTIALGEDVFEYVFGTADRGRTVFAMRRNGAPAQVTAGRPPRPVLAGLPPVHRGSRYAKEGPALGPPPQPRDPDPVSLRVFTDTATLAFVSTGPGQEVRYTLDGAAPGRDSTLYLGPVAIADSAIVKAVTRSRYWPFGQQDVSEVVEARFVKQSPLPPQAPARTTLAPGLLCDVFEIFRPEWDRDGFVNPSVNYLPDVAKYTPLLTVATPGFALPPVRGQQPIEEVYKGYYRFRGYLDMAATGVYRFAILSNGPLRLAVAGQTVIEETGYYHLDQRERYGQIALAAGLHQVELTVCDPIFWKKERDGEMPFAVRYAVADQPLTDLAHVLAPAAELTKHRANRFAAAQTEIPLLTAQAPREQLVRGLVRATYARVALVPASDGWLFSQKAGPAGLFDTGRLSPVCTELADDEIAGSDYDGQLYVYTGWYKAPYDGVYRFALDGKGNNQLALDSKVIVQNNVPGEQVDGRIRLQAGYHEFVLKYGRSPGGVKVQTPADSGLVALTLGDLFRPTSPKLLDDPESFLVLGLPEAAYAKPEQTVKTSQGSYRLGVTGAKVVGDSALGQVIELTGEQSGLRLYDWPCVGRYLTMAFWVKLPDQAPSKEYLQIGREGATGLLDSRGVSVSFPRFYVTGNSVRIKDLEQGKWVHLTLEWGPTTKVFVNGELVSTRYAAGDPCMQSRPQNHNARSEQMQLFVGRDGSFRGWVAGLRVYDALLANDYVKALYTKSRKPHDPAP